MGVGADGFRGRLKWKRKSESAWLAALEGIGGQIRFPLENGSDPSSISIPGRSHPRMAWIDRVDQGRHLPTAAGTCRRRGTVGLRGVSRMDAATKPPWMGLRRPRKPTVPRHPAGSPLLLRLLQLLQPLPLRVPGATRPPFPQGQAGGAAAQACCTSASEARSSSRHNGNNCAKRLLSLHCVGSVRTAAAYHCTASCFCPARHSASA